MIANELIGTWSLLSWQRRNESTSEITEPLGGRPVGLLQYGADGYMSLVVSRRERPKPVGDDVVGGSDEERALAAGSVVAFAGRYAIDENWSTVHHLIETSLFSGWVGATRSQLVTIDGDKLELRTSGFSLNGKQHTAIVRWHRASPR